MYAKSLYFPFQKLSFNMTLQLVRRQGRTPDRLCDITRRFAGASHSKLGNGLGAIVDANAFDSVSTRPGPWGCAVRVLGGAQVLKMS